jgi:hypothetical protein
MGGWNQNRSWEDWLGEGVEWTQVAQDRGWWRTIVTAVKNL